MRGKRPGRGRDLRLVMPLVANRPIPGLPMKKTDTRGFRLAALSLCLPLAGTALAQGPATAGTEITGTRIAGPLSSQPLSVGVITAEEIRSSGATTVNDALIRLLGVGAKFERYGGGEYVMDIGGFGKTADANQVFMVDGVRLKEFDFDSGRLSGIPIDSVAKIEVIRGSGGVLYGAGSTGGVIAITTKARAGVERSTGVSVYTGLDSDSFGEVRVNGTVVNGGFSFDANALRRNTHNYRDNQEAGNGALALSAQWKNDWFRAGVSRAQDSLNTGAPGPLTPAQYQSVPRQASTPTDRQLINVVRQGIFAEANVGDWLLYADIGRRDKKQERYTGGASGGVATVKANEIALRATYGVRGISWANRFTLGSDYDYWKRETPAAALVASQFTRGVYLRNELTVLSSGTVIVGGLRSDRVTGHNDNGAGGVPDQSARMPSWELGVTQPLNTELAVYGRAGRSMRAATVEEFNWTRIGVLLRPQVSRDIEFGSRYASGPYKLNARFFHSSLTDEIGYDLAQSTALAAFGANVNYDRTKRSGIELEGRYAHSKNLDLRVNAAFHRAKFGQGVYAGKDLVRAPRAMVSAHADWRLPEGHMISGGINVVSDQKLDIANICTMPGYGYADARYSYQWKASEFSVGVTNLFAKKFFTNTECDAGPGATTGVPNTIFPEPGRLLVLAFRTKF